MPGRRRAATAESDLIEQHLHLARWVAVGMHRQWPWLELDDLVGWAHEGLIAAAKRFDPGRGLSFAGYASNRMRGIILDRLRQYNRWSRTHKMVTVVSVMSRTALGLEHPIVNRFGEEAVLVDVVADPAADPADQVVDRDELRRALATLTHRQRDLVLSHLGGETLAHIGARFGVTESRACQIRKSALDRMGSVLADVGGG